MATKVLTKGKQGKATGKTPVGGLGFWAGATLKENNTIYYQGPKKQPSPLKEPGCTQVFINKEREVSASRSTKRYKIMKKFSLLLMLLAVLTVFNGCQKDEPVVIDEQSFGKLDSPMFANLNEIAFSVEDNRLVFETENDFQKCIDFLAQLGDKNFPSFEDAIGFQSYRKIFQNDPEKSSVFVDELYQVMLSPEMEIVIGDYLFREEPFLGITHAFEYIHDNNIEYILDNIYPKYSFAWHDDAFETLNSQGSNILKSATSDYCDSSNKDKEQDIIIQSGNWGNTSWSNPYAYRIRMKAKLCFQKTAIFKSIICKYTKVESASQCVNQYWDGFTHCQGMGVYAKAYFKSIGNAKYKRNNETKFSESIYQQFYPHTGEDEISWRPFYGTRRVDCYNITMEYGFNIYNGAVLPHINGFTEIVILSIDCD